MKISRLILSFISFLFLLPNAKSQKIDSLMHVYNNCKEDTIKIRTTLRICRAYMTVQVDSMGKYAQYSYQLSQKLNYKYGKLRSIHFLANYNYNKGNLKEALEISNEKLKLLDPNTDKAEIATTVGNMAIIYQSQGGLEDALRLYFKALKIEEELKNDEGIMRNLGNIGTIYLYKKEVRTALEYFRKALEMAHALKSPDYELPNLCNMGSIYYELRQFEKSLDYYNQVVVLSKQINDIMSLQTAYVNIGTIFMSIGDSLIKRDKMKANPHYSKALQYFTQAVKLAKLSGDYNELANTYGYLGDLYASLKQFGKAEEYLKLSLQAADSIGDLTMRKLQHYALSELYEETNRPELSLFHYKNYIAVRDSIFNEENTKKTVRLEMNYEFEKKTAANRLEQEKKEAIAASENKKQRIIIWSICLILLMVMAFTFYVIRSFLQKRKANIEITKQKEIIEEKQKEMLDSINYAKRIQQALLTSELYFDRNLKKLNKN